MANTKVVLLLRIRLGDGERVYAKPAIAKNGKIKPLAADIDGKVDDHPEGVYVLRYRDEGRVTYRQVGTDSDAVSRQNSIWHDKDMSFEFESVRHGCPWRSGVFRGPRCIMATPLTAVHPGL
jgi:hypothetical protein